MNQLQLSKYEVSKDSGAPWIGKIPKHWKIKKGKWLFQKIDRKVQKDDETITCFRDGEVTLRSNRRTEGFTNAVKEHGYQGIRKGDLVIHAMDAFAGAIGVSDSDGKSTPVYSVCIERFNNSVNQYYYAYLLRNFALNGAILSLAKGIRERSTDFRYNDFGELLLTYPPLPEQTAIATFLDEKTAKIDQAIKQKERLIELLKERKQIFTQELVTGKKVWNEETQSWEKPKETIDSGVKWIGEIPTGWGIKPGLCFLKEKNNSNKGMKESTVLSLSYGKIVIKPDEKLIGLVPESFETYQIVDPGDIIIRCTDLQNDQTSLRTAISSYRGIITTAYLNLTVSNSNSEFIHYYLHALDLTKVLYKFGSGLRQNLSWGDFKRLPILDVPKESQERILNFIKKIEENSNNSIKHLNSQISKLKEYKAVLVDSAVTGKIKVPGVY